VRFISRSSCKDRPKKPLRPSHVLNPLISRLIGLDGFSAVRLRNPLIPIALQQKLIILYRPARKPILHMFFPLANRIVGHFLSSTSSRSPIDGQTSFEGSKAERSFGRCWNGLFKRPSRGSVFCGASVTSTDEYNAGSVTFDMLPDDVLLDIFDFFRMDSYYYPWRWHTLVHVCRRWRHVIFASPRRLDLQFLCTPNTPVRELLDFLPPTMPIMISNWSGGQQPYDPLSLEGGHQVISAIEKRDRVRWVHLDGITSPLLEKLVGMMQETFPMMEFVRLWSEDETVPVLPEAFLGGSCPRLYTFWLSGIPFPQLPRLLSSTDDLVVLRLEKIPDSGYIPCDVMAAGLSTSTKLETLIIEFQSMAPHPDGTGTQPTASLTRTALPALTLFRFRGHGGYFDNFVVRFESHLLVPDFDQSWSGNVTNRELLYEASYSQSGLRLHSEYSIPN
jgi:hypothetical protein